MEEKPWCSDDEADGNRDGGCMPAVNDDRESEWQASILYEVYVWTVTAMQVAARVVWSTIDLYFSKSAPWPACFPARPVPRLLNTFSILCP